MVGGITAGAPGLAADGAVVVEEVVGAAGAAELLAAVGAAVVAAATADVVVAVGGETWGPVTVVAGLEAEG